ncbi:hypothetical protein [Marinoscillum sp.]|uniref:hypothetical protein n=1 Tax=Marinoscillum sp. TaxID=2024838 RepID=UPI003BA93158
MIKTLIKYLLSLCILLLIGHGQGSSSVDGYTFNESYGEFDSQTLGIPYHEEGLAFSPASSAAKKEVAIISAAEYEEKEDEKNSSRKHLVPNSHYASHFYTQLPGDYFRYLRKNLALRNYFNYFSSYESLNILLCVIRI